MRSSKRWSARFPAIDKVLLSVANAGRLSKYTFSASLQIYHKPHHTKPHNRLIQNFSPSKLKCTSCACMIFGYESRSTTPFVSLSVDNNNCKNFFVYRTLWWPLVHWLIPILAHISSQLLRQKDVYATCPFTLDAINTGWGQCQTHSISQVSFTSALYIMIHLSTLFLMNMLCENNDYEYSWVMDQKRLNKPDRLTQINQTSKLQTASKKAQQSGNKCI